MGLSAPSLYRRRASAADQAFLRRQHSVWGCGHANRLQGIPCCATPAHAKRRTCEDPACTPCDVVLTRFLAPPYITEEALLAETLLHLTSIRTKTCGGSNASRKTLGARPAANGRQDANICWKTDDNHAQLRPLPGYGIMERRAGYGKQRTSISVDWRSGSATALQAVGRGFKSLIDHHENAGRQSLQTAGLFRSPNNSPVRNFRRGRPLPLRAPKERLGTAANRACLPAADPPP